MSRANSSTSRAPRSRVPRLPVVAASRFSSISAKKLFEGTFVSSISVATSGESTDAIGSSVLLGVGQVRAADRSRSP